MGKPLNVETEPRCDCDLHFDIWDLEKSDFFKLFEFFPEGQKIAEKAYQLRWGGNHGLNSKFNSEEEIIAEVNKSINDIQKLFPSKELDDPKITIQYGDDKLRLELLSKSDPISIELDDQLARFIKNENGEQAYQAYFFLSEPMYRLASSYIISDWILWTLTNRYDVDPYTPLLRLYYNNCDVVLTNDGVLVFKLIDNN